MLRQLSRRRASYRRLNMQGADKEKEGESVPKGYVPVMVGTGKDSAKFLIHIDIFKNDYFAGLLEIVAEEVGYENPGILRIPCDADCFRNLLNEISRVN
ncbi:SAUR-like auxin-responsive protein family, putative [Theobroma cacao]|uniref:SAUR-like auxin-responsive protein family, putative n=1 Tax=Theobroma cacao TaxID=3641 RepID=A0A061GK27_THECC|nr:SAUR-like auxin-responsive protein family, putative [Theobroma cacao]